ncbi:MAG TPA: SBBP repeat-containing protein, partial [Ramlibacter sp.]|nr:SBBP repeat-containing protein [Ramlibacter sp.]
MVLAWLRRRKPTPRRQAPEAEWLEPRLLYSADAAAAWLPAPLTQEEGETRSLNATGDYITATPSAQAVAEAYATTALNFERNDGQDADGIDFVARGSGYAIALFDADAAIVLTGAQEPVRLHLVGANPDAAVHGEDPLQVRSNYLVGDASRWRTDIPNFAAVRYADAWQGIDVRYYGTQRQLEYDFIVAAGADAGQIRMRFDGASESIDEAGNLVLLTPEGRELRFAAPVSYQLGAAGREAVESRYVLHDDGSVGFELGAYDAGRTLVIDPVLSYGSYMGGGGDETATDVAVDSLGYVYMTGYTASTSGLVGSLLGGLGSLGGLLGGTGEDVFVARFNASLSAMDYMTRVGGGDDDRGLSIAVNAAREAIVTGSTKSADFGTSTGAPDTGLGGNQDAFVMRLGNNGATVQFSTYFGDGGNRESGNAVAVDAAGDIYVAGARTGQSGGGTDAWIARYSSTGSLQHSLTFGSGGATEYASDIALDGSGNVYVIGDTNSNDIVLASGPVTTAPGGKEAFLLRYDSSMTLTWGTYVGGNQDDLATALAVDAAGRAYVVGQTSNSDVSTFTATPGALRSTGITGMTGYLAIYDTGVSGAGALRYMTLVGGSTAGDLPTGVALAGNRVAVVSQAQSTDMPLTSDALQSSNTSDGMHVAVIAPESQGTADLRYGTYYGTNLLPDAVAIDATTQVLYIPGTTNTANLARPGGADMGANGGDDALLLGLRLNTAPVLTAANALPAVLEDSSGGTGVLVASLL